jgi:hypothetical protein
VSRFSSLTKKIGRLDASQAINNEGGTNLSEVDAKLTKILAMLHSQPAYSYAPSTPSLPEVPSSNKVQLSSQTGYAVAHADLMAEIKQHFKLKQV